MSKRNSVNQIVEYLLKYPYEPENSINSNVFGYYRNSSYESNKKYAELLRRALRKGLIKRVKVEGKSYKYVYYI